MPHRGPTVPTNRSQLAGVTGDVTNAITINRDQFPWGIPNTPASIQSLPTVPGLSFGGATLQTRAPQFFQSGVGSEQMARVYQRILDRRSALMSGILNTYLSRIRGSIGGPVSIGHNPDTGFVNLP